MEAAALELPPTPATSGKCPTLLVVDSDAAVLSLVERLGTDLGFHVVRETDSRAVIDALPHTRPDGAIIDVSQSSVGGLTLLKEIKAADPQSQVVLMTA